MNKWLMVVGLVLSILAGAMGLRNVLTSKAAGSGTVVLADGGPVPPTPWKN